MAAEDENDIHDAVEILQQMSKHFDDHPGPDKTKHPHLKTIEEVKRDLGLCSDNGKTADANLAEIVQDISRRVLAIECKLNN
jgi:hypothetical protein